MSDNTPPVALEPCPFCNVAMNADADAGTFGHPDSESECILAKHAWALLPKYTAMWNTRTRTPSHSDLVEALRDARKIIADIDDYMKRPGRGDWGEECACCMGELLDDDRQAIAKIDAILTKAEAPHG